MLMPVFTSTRVWCPLHSQVKHLLLVQCVDVSDVRERVNTCLYSFVFYNLGV